MAPGKVVQLVDELSINCDIHRRTDNGNHVLSGRPVEQRNGNLVKELKEWVRLAAVHQVHPVGVRAQVGCYDHESVVWRLRHRAEGLRGTQPRTSFLSGPADR